MTLKISDTTRKIFRILGIVLLAGLAACIVKVAIWEYHYYNDKEGEARTLPVSSETPIYTEEQEADETEVTEEVIREYTVAPDKPRYLSIAKLSTSKARVIEVAANPGKPMGVPAGIYDVGWARNSGKPGQGSTLLLDGHNGGPTKAGVFKRLGILQPGDIILIERGDGALFEYEVFDIKVLKVKEADEYMNVLMDSPVPGRESLSIITCTGEWINSARTYDSRIMLRAVLVQ